MTDDYSLHIESIHSRLLQSFKWKKNVACNLFEIGVMWDVAEMIEEKWECNSIPALFELWAQHPPCLCPHSVNADLHTKVVFFSNSHTISSPVHDMRLTKERAIYVSEYNILRFSSVCNFIPFVRVDIITTKWIMWRRKMGWKLYNFMARIFLSFLFARSYSSCSRTAHLTVRQ